MDLALFGSVTSGSLLEDGAFLIKEGLGGTGAPLPGKPSDTVLFMCDACPESVGCSGCLECTALVEVASSLVDPLA